MILHIYSILDLKGVAFATPFFMHTDGIAIRSFQDALSDPKSALSQHPEDYVLYRLGDFNDQGGKVEALADGPIALIAGNGEVLSNG